MKKKEISKKQILLLISSVLFVIVLLNNASGASCDIQYNVNGVCNSGYKVMGLSAMTNAHGELASQTNYALVLCCDFGTGDTTCDGRNKIIGLSSPTNAHAEIPSETTYTNHVCYEDLECAYTTNPSCPTEYPLEALSLSSPTNAHLGAFADYSTKICCADLSMPLCSLTSAYWSLDKINPITSGDKAFKGQKVYLVVEGTNCNTKYVSFDVEEGGTISQGPATNQPLNAKFSGSEAIGNWTAEWVSDAGGNPEWYFTAEIAESVPLENIESSEPKLEVSNDEYCFENNIFSCGDYDEEHCNIDPCEVASDDVGCNPLASSCWCSWDAEGGECKALWEDNGECGDGFIGVGEQCEDDSDITLTCDRFGFEGGILSCVNCMINTSLCTGGTAGECGEDGVINIGEQCEQDSDLISFSCTDFDDFSGEGLFCNSNCMIDTSECGGGEIGGTCEITQTIENDCDEEPVGLYSFLLKGVWTGIESGDAYLSCIEEKPPQGIECPAQVQLPFFNFYNVIITLVLIALIYVSLIFKRKKK